MANIYFSSPVLEKNRKVVAVAGSRDTILKVAKREGIPVPHDCEDGECGNCVVRVTHLDGYRIKGVMLTPKEHAVLEKLGLLDERDEEQAYVNDIPPVHRLACQCVVTDEDLLVQFSGKPRNA